MVDLNSLSLPLLFEELTSDGSFDRLVFAAMEEDFGSVGDITTQSIINPGEICHASLVGRTSGTVSGLLVAERILKEQAAMRVQLMHADGEEIDADGVLAAISGSRHRLLCVERLVLNLLGRLSGIATLTRRFVEEVKGTRAVICDTRKTTPGLRNLEKYAVRCGGGVLHRLGLFDAALFKDNHLAGIPLSELNVRLTQAIQNIRSEYMVRFVQVEVDTLEQLQHLLAMPAHLVDMILLDNFSVDTLRLAVLMRDERAPQIKLEASGGVSLGTVRSIAGTGVDRISVGAITHSAPWLDVGLDMV